MYETQEFKKGLRIEIDKVPFILLELQFVKPGKGQAFTRVKMRNLLNGNVLEKTFKSGEKVDQADVEDITVQFLYLSDETYHFMNNSTYDQNEVPKKVLNDSWKWIQEGMICTMTIYNGTPISVVLPNFTEIEITYCEPGLKGDTATGATKNAELSTGANVNVPLFVNQNDWIRIDTRTGEYIERVKK